MASGADLHLVAKITPSRSLTWVATSWRYESAVPLVVTGAVGAELVCEPPVTDQAGWRIKDGALLDVSAPGSYTHTYTIVVETYSGATRVTEDTYTRVVLPTGDLSPVDLDDFLAVGTTAGATVLIPDTWTAAVTAAEAAVLDMQATLTSEDVAVAGLIADAGSATRSALNERLVALDRLMEAERYTAMTRLLQAPVAQDMPVVEVVPYSAPAGETLHELLRVGGSSANNVDLAGDPKFRYDGTPALIPVPAINTYAQAPLLTGGVSQGAYYSAAYETITSATNTLVKWQVRPSTTSLSVRVSVNGHPTSDTQITVTGLTAGNAYYLRLTFPVPASRLIKVTFIGATGVRGVVIPTAEALTRPTTAIAKRVAILGDSYEGGSGLWPDGGYRLETAGYRVAMMLGADSIWHFGIGGTGYVAAPDANSFLTRCADIVACDPDMVIVSGSINDGPDDTPGIRSAVAAVLAALSSVPQVYVTGPSYPTGYAGNNTAVREATLAAGRVYIDPLAEPWLVAPDHIRSDLVHPNGAGHIRRASRLYEGIAASLAP